MHNRSLSLTAPFPLTNRAGSWTYRSRTTAAPTVTLHRFYSTATRPDNDAHHSLKAQEPPRSAGLKAGTFDWVITGLSAKRRR